MPYLSQAAVKFVSKMKYNDILVIVACAVHARMVAQEAANPHRTTQRARGVHPGVVGVGSW